MINNLTSSSNHLATTSFSAPYIANNGQSAGAMRFNTSLQQVEVYDGISWINVSMNANLALTVSAESVIHWAQNKMREEQELLKLAEESEAVKIALENRKQAEEQLRITAHLAKEIV